MLHFLIIGAFLKCAIAKVGFEKNKISQGFEALARAQCLLRSKISLGKMTLLSQVTMLLCSSTFNRLLLFPCSGPMNFECTFWQPWFWMWKWLVFIVRVQTVKVWLNLYWYVIDNSMVLMMLLLLHECLKYIKIDGLMTCMFCTLLLLP